jgi:2-polyprenyl-3-methyl-5-hydroxy-6-metoxy-1,4-benzoquinol methylase
LRLFRDKGDFDAEGFYDVYGEECSQISERRKSEHKQLLDLLSLTGFDISEKTVLDISGGPGYLGQQLKGLCSRCVVTEFSESAVANMASTLEIETVKFDYNTDKPEELFTEKFDLILLRSSIIFCANLDELVGSLRGLLSPNGHVLVETIIPSLGEVLWWQQMEYKFPVIYSQETIEKYFYKHGFSLVAGYRDYGSYTGVKRRSYSGLLRNLYVWLIDYPMVLIYYAFVQRSKVPIDTKLHHKMLTQFWQKTDRCENVQEQPYRNFTAGAENQSKHFGFVYNGYLQR